MYFNIINTLKSAKSSIEIIFYNAKSSYSALIYSVLSNVILRTIGCNTGKFW